MLKLYDYFRASSCYRLRIALNLKGLEYETIHIDLVKGEHGTEGYKAINPLGTVPYFIDGEVELNQSIAILEYLDELYPEPKLVHGTAAQKAHIRQLAQLVATDMHPFGAPQVWRKYLMGVLDVSEGDALKWVQHWITRGLTTYEKMIETTAKEFSCGNTISLADICLLPQLYNARRYKVELHDYKNLLQIEQNMLQNESVRAARPEAHPEAPEGLEEIHR